MKRSKCMLGVLDWVVQPTVWICVLSGLLLLLLAQCGVRRHETRRSDEVTTVDQGMHMEELRMRGQVTEQQRREERHRWSYGRDSMVIRWWGDVLPILSPTILPIDSVLRSEPPEDPSWRPLGSPGRGGLVVVSHHTSTDSTVDRDASHVEAMDTVTSVVLGEGYRSYSSRNEEQQRLSQSTSRRCCSVIVLLVSGAIAVMILWAKKSKWW